MLGSIAVKSIKFIVIVGLILYLIFMVICFAVLGPIGKRNIEERGLTYEKFLNKQPYSGRVSLPITATNIDVFLYLGFDTNYRFIQAKVDLKEPFLAFVQKGTEKLPAKKKIVNATFSMPRFDEVFGHYNHIHIPKWWNETELRKFDQNYFVAWQENEYGHGLWYFYDTQNHDMRVFEWSQQHLNMNRLETLFVSKP